MLGAGGQAALHPNRQANSAPWWCLHGRAGLAFLLLMWLALHQLGQRAYYEYRIQNLAARLALRTRVPTYVLYTVRAAAPCA